MKLKTLNDIEEDSEKLEMMDFASPRDINILRQGTKIGFKRAREEAIKWIKDVGEAPAWVYLFFNITEEDLK